MKINYNLFYTELIKNKKKTFIELQLDVLLTTLRQHLNFDDSRDECDDCQLSKVQLNYLRKSTIIDINKL